MTMTSAPAPSRLTTSRAWRWARAKREGEASVAFIEADVSSTTTMRFAPCPMTVTAGRARARAKASRARSCRIKSGSRWRRWKNVDASRSRRAGSHRRRLGTVASRRRTLRKYRSTSGMERARTRKARARAAERLRGHGEVPRLTRLDIGEPEIACDHRIHLIRGQDVDYVKIEAVLEQGPEPSLVSGGIQQIGDEHGHPCLTGAQGIVRQTFAESRKS